jgi:hypothetical protein
MKKLNMSNTGARELSREEAMSIVGGENILGYLKCVAGTITGSGGGNGGLKSFVLGVTLFGMARMVGVMVGCSNI